MVQLETFQKVVKKIFSPKSFPAEYDSAIYLSEYDIANEFDLDILQMTLSLAHLVQKGIMSPLTQVYSTYKVGKVDEDAFSALTSKLESNSGTGFVLDDVEYTLEDLADFNQNALQTVLIVADHIRDTAKRKWTTIDAVSLSNKCACTPATIASTIGTYVRSLLCFCSFLSSSVLYCSILLCFLLNFALLYQLDISYSDSLTISLFS